MEYEVTKENLDYIPPYLMERVARNIHKMWPVLRAQLNDLTVGNEVVVTFAFRFRVVRRAYDDEGRVTQEFVVVSPALDRGDDEVVNDAGGGWYE